MRRTRAVALLAAIPLIAAACGSDDTDEAIASIAGEASTSTAAPTDTTEEVMADDDMASDEMASDEMADDDMVSDDMAADMADDMAENEMADEMAPVTFTVRVENVSGWSDIRRNVVFNTPSGDSAPGPLLPGGMYQAVVAASPGEKVSFATMFVQSNDWFVASGIDGISLYDDTGNPISGDVTDQLLLLDAGTEVDQEPGGGADQPPRQDGPNTGAVDVDMTVRTVEGRDASDYVTVDVVSLGSGNFMITIENVSAASTLATPFAPGVAVTHVGVNPLFVLGEKDGGNGLEALAEDGDPSRLAEHLATQISLPTPIAPVVAVVHGGPNPIFAAGSGTKAEGLEILAEDGDPAALAASTGGVVTAIPVGSDDAGPIFPGDSYEFTVEVPQGHRLSFAAMFVQSNDWFIALDSLDLFADGEPISGEFGSLISLWDAGTEADQTPGVGPDQAPRQMDPNTGDVDPDQAVRLIGSGEGVVGNNIVTVTISAG